MLDGRCVMVVIVHENAHIKACDVIDYLIFSLCRARESEIDIVEIKIAAKEILIAGARARCATALRYGRAVENYGLFVLI